MPIEIRQERGNVYRVAISGVLGIAELARCEATLAGAIARMGSVKLLCVLTAFEGWESHPNWNSLAFYVTHGDAITRIAIVGDERWRSETMMFAAADLRSAPVEFFTADRLAEAQAWLSGDAGTGL